VGVADLAPTLAIRALKEKGMPYDLYLVEGADKGKVRRAEHPRFGRLKS
jgi:glyceraldehyde-3-phosphate dehydrogenase (NAD(P))